MANGFLVVLIILPVSVSGIWRMNPHKNIETTLERIDDAIFVFKMNVDIYLESWNAYDSLGEGHLVSGD